MISASLCPSLLRSALLHCTPDRTSFQRHATNLRSHTISNAPLCVASHRCVTPHTAPFCCSSHCNASSFSVFASHCYSISRGSPLRCSTQRFIKPRFEGDHAALYIASPRSAAHCHAPHRKSTRRQLTACLTQNRAVLVYTWYQNAEKADFGRCFEDDSPIDTQEVTDSSSVEPTTNSLIPVSHSVKSSDSKSPFDRLIHRKPVRIGSHLVTEAREQ
jgi:hypothetical protein